MSATASVEQPRRLRVRRLLLAWGLCSLSAIVGVALTAKPAYAWDLPKPVTSPFGTPAVDTGTKPTGLCRAAGATGCVVIAGAAAYQGTCWALGEIFNDPNGCAEGVDTLLSFIPGVGHADESSNYSGPLAIVSPQNYAGASTPFDVTIFVTGTALSASTTRIRIFYPSGGSACHLFWRPTAESVTINLVQQRGTDYQMIQNTLQPGNSNGGNGCSGNVPPDYISKIDVMDRGPSLSDPSDDTIYASWVPDTNMDKPYDMQYERKCVGGAAGSGQSITATESFIPSAGVASPGVSLPTCSTAYPGSTETGLGITGDRAGITSPNPAVKVDVGGFTDEQKLDYPLCTTGAQAGQCWLDLQRDGKSCFGPNVYCKGWQQNIVRWNMSCEWGPYLMPIARCEEKYATTFTDQPQPDPNPKPTPTAPPGPTNPGSGNNPSAPPTDPTTDTDPNTKGCFGDAFTLNPVDWVYVPVKCAFIWAFVPKTALSTRVSTVSDAFADAPPFTWFAGMGAVPAAIPSNGCPNWRVKVAGLDKNVVCGSSFTEAVRDGRPIFAALMITAAFAPFLRSLAYSAIPIISPVPH